MMSSNIDSWVLFTDVSLTSCCSGWQWGWHVWVWRHWEVGWWWRNINLARITKWDNQTGEKIIIKLWGKMTLNIELVTVKCICSFQLSILYLCRPALTPWILLKISSQWRSTSEKSRRCCQCTCTREESPPLPSLDQRNNLKKLNLHNCVDLFISLCILVSNWKVLIKQWMAFLPKQINYE